MKPCNAIKSRQQGSPKHSLQLVVQEVHCGKLRKVNTSKQMWVVTAAGHCAPFPSQHDSGCPRNEVPLHKSVAHYSLPVLTTICISHVLAELGTMVSPSSTELKDCVQNLILNVGLVHNCYVRCGQPLLCVWCVYGLVCRAWSDTVTHVT